ncbi:MULTISPECIES: hypothetical protein [Olivibacter]|jgi:hypothetical protein|uniref:Bile acid:sodium symporter n=3 Tax=Sphingobacteriaceae TaxID=84566 RepID=F4CDZ6_SPHS2|nr:MULTISPECIES: hypothetical protein [Olivibacter]MCL4640283.1 hypothetical protein [Olivibacter sp. UJ_SKK_5.1]QEL03795.1 hypothetical protein FKG96_24180 [Olivibacter sp. LS-1]
MKKLFLVLMAAIYSNLALANQVGTDEEYSTPKTVAYLVIGVILVTIIATVLYKRPKRKFNE